MTRNTLLLAMLLFILCSLSSGQSLFFEAEEAELSGVYKATSRSGFSGSGYVTGFEDENDQVTFEFAAWPGLYELRIGYASPFGEKGYELILNGQSSTGMFTGPQTSFTAHRAGTVKLQSGTNTISIVKNWGWYEIDYIELKSTEVHLPQKPPKAPANSHADASTRALLAYLVDNYGRKTLSGQQNLSEIQYIENQTGKSPAIGCFDLMDYSPSRIEFGANPDGAVEKWIEWALKSGGIVSLSWHWNAPTDLINESGGKEWWRGFYTEATTFDLAAALADTTSIEYELLLRDMDAIALQLEKFKSHDLPVLWRPLHEAGGGWFWWGAKGATPYKELWKLMFQRFTTKHNLTNLLWVCTPEKFDWYPGDASVDILGLDIYTSETDPMNGHWESALDIMDGRKLIALSESGTMPDPDNIRTFGTWWSWFSLWTGNDFIRGVPFSLLQKTYADPDIITLDELPDWRNYSSVKSYSQQPGKENLAIFPNPSNSQVNLQFRLPEFSPVQITIFNLQGREIETLFEGSMMAGTHTISTDTGPWSSGLYWVQIRTALFTAQQKFIVLK